MRKSKQVVIYSNEFSMERFTETRLTLSEEQNVQPEDIDTMYVHQALCDEDTINAEDVHNTLSDLDRFERMKKYVAGAADKVTHPIVLIGTIQIWRGTFDAHKSVEKLTDIFTPFSDCEDLRVYAEDKRIFIRGVHHDGANVMEIRILRDRITSDCYDDARIRNDFKRLRNITKSAYPLFVQAFNLKK